MSAIWYLYKKSLKNWAKKAIKKPMTYLYLVLILFYGLMLPFSMNLLLSEYGMDTPATMAAACSVVVFWLIPANMISYVKRKGLLYKKGDVLATTVVYPTPPQSKTEESIEKLKALIEKHNVDIISIGNGTASKEAEIFVAELIKHCSRPVSYAVVSEAGASVYSASKLGAEEFPDYDVTARSAVSIARRNLSALENINMICHKIDSQKF